MSEPEVCDTYAGIHTEPARRGHLVQIPGHHHPDGTPIWGYQITCQCGRVLYFYEIYEKENDEIRITTVHA